MQKGKIKMIYSIDEVKERIKPIAERYNLPIVYLFGSYARGEEKDGSDLDFLIRRTGSDISSALQIGGLYADLDETFDTSIDLVTEETFSQPDTIRRHSDFIYNIERDRVIVYEGLVCSRLSSDGYKNNLGDCIGRCSDIA
ncbi:MAG: nucleotidyltransferase domain-containing protein [Clostridiales Family XIII bacterium]|jgi:predicted nucleotidyltransferase|nr:nucleotidyltransferase domain-containing protein [Clostridiales Family XIII bacterium]